MNIDSLISNACNDPSLSSQERMQLLEYCKKPEVIKFLSGAAGAVIGVVLAKYAKLGRTSQILLGLAGYGAGRLLYNHLMHKHGHRQFANYSDKIKAYEIDAGKY